MNEFIIQHEATIRLIFFFGILGTMALWEIVAPRRTLTVAKWLRWTNNISLVVFNTILLRLIFPAAAVGMAIFTETHAWGILNFYAFPHWITVIIAVVALDFVIWLQHIMVHAIPVLWRLHRVHHADLDFDVTTGSRFHPLEILLSMLIKFVTIAALGPPIVAVIIFEVILNGVAMFNHSNIKLPIGLDRILRWFIVTPDMHRVHHSIEDHETNSNFGFNLSIWDRLFGTYQDQPDAGHTGMTIGIHHFRDVQQVTLLPGLLLLPFKGKISSYVINRRKW